ncbi:hypothetical protein ACHHYP_20733 [Achlya hypogyna]|uniref:Uncharacterized protein n=1 Tax=Achlya hypogyna TaxID=1202772 RepID=A0A1V9YDA8_ACHHY|nr:hypothetical protein ACHHYP_20733 [Achlya hypogyna]
MLIGVAIGVVACAIVGAIIVAKRTAGAKPPSSPSLEATLEASATLAPAYEAQETSRVSAVLLQAPSRRPSSVVVRESSVHSLLAFPGRATVGRRGSLPLPAAEDPICDTESTLFATTTSVRSVMSYSNGSPVRSPINGSFDTACASENSTGFFIASDSDSVFDPREFNSILTRPTMDSVGSSVFTPRHASPPTSRGVDDV